MREKESEPLISNHDEDEDEDDDEDEQSCKSEGFMEEAKLQLGLAIPLIVVNMLQYCLQVISLMFVGHLGELQLSSASMATSFASVTGFSVLVSALRLHFSRFHPIKHKISVQT